MNVWIKQLTGFGFAAYTSEGRIDYDRKLSDLKRRLVANGYKIVEVE